MALLTALRPQKAGARQLSAPVSSSSQASGQNSFLLPPGTDTRLALWVGPGQRQLDAEGSRGCASYGGIHSARSHPRPCQAGVSVPDPIRGPGRSGLWDCRGTARSREWDPHPGVMLDPPQVLWDCTGRAASQR